ncbi:MAG: hypothetical protein ACSW8B_01980, partial [bacterium]
MEYQHDGHWHVESANGDYIFATKDGQEYFLKRFREPKYPRAGSSSAYVMQKVKECEEFRDNHQRLIDALSTVASGGGN